MDEETARAAVREAIRVTRHHVFVVVMTCGKTLVPPECEAKNHPWVRTVQSAAWWLRLLKGEGLLEERLTHIFNERLCLPEEINPKFPDRTICQAWFEHFRFEGSSELQQANIFAMVKQTAVASASPSGGGGGGGGRRRQRPPVEGEDSTWALSESPPAPPLSRVDPRLIPLKKTRMGGSSPPAPRSAMRAQVPHPLLLCHTPFPLTVLPPPPLNVALSTANVSLRESISRPLARYHFTPECTYFVTTEQIDANGKLIGCSTC
jgi:hypothetical protein